MSDYGPPPRRIVTTNVPISTAVSDTDSWEPAVDAIEEEVPRVSLLGGQAAKYPVFTHMQVPVNANAPYVILCQLFVLQTLPAKLFRLLVGALTRKIE